MDVDCILTASAQNWTGAWESVIISQAFAVMVPGHSLRNTDLVVRVRRALFLCCATFREHREESHVMVISLAILASESFNFIALAHSINLGLQGHIGGSASF